ncbi:hypothetical protein CDO31_23515 (plasmid) [Sinorhizobium meliloti]|nr:hypothetical protein CDO31_23515 [Sinorhizobium meliloti]
MNTRKLTWLDKASAKVASASGALYRRLEGSSQPAPTATPIGDRFFVSGASMNIPSQKSANSEAIRPLIPK